ncbi:probable cytochrome P450 6a23 [Rhodnius prolixus]|uniref:probable cytochrome P450 6a23 n=1 Tax=Rhodnius prolixus TaxID=13249 RepID=UPI003D187EB0
MTTDFPHFVDHPIVSEEKGLLHSILFQMKDKKWKGVRSKITPAFSSGKLKMIFLHMLECTEELINSNNENINKDYEIKNDLSTFSMNVIGNAIFGIQLTNKQASTEFQKMSSSLFVLNPFRFLATFIIINAPKFSNLFGLTFFSTEVTQYFEGLIKNTFEQRINISAMITSNKITDELLTGQAFQFIIAGHDFLYLNILYSMFEIARVNHIQERLRKEVRDALKKCGGYTYEALKEMTYLEQCIQGKCLVLI